MAKILGIDLGTTNSVSYTHLGHAFRDAAAPHLLMLPAVSSGVAFPAFWQGSGWGRLPAGLAFHSNTTFSVFTARFK